MSSLRTLIRRLAGVIPLAAMLAVPGCSKNSDGSVTITTPTGNFTLSAAAVALLQGGTNATAVTINRTGGFTGTVALTVEGLPNGLTATLSPSSTTGTTSTLSVSATATILAATYSVTVRGTSSGLSDQTTVVQVTISAAGAGGGFTLSGASASLAQSGNITANITINRTGGFAGAVAFTATGQPTGLTVSFNPASTTGNSTVVSLTATATVAVGVYAVVIHGNATGLAEQTSTLSVTITIAGGGGGSGNITLDFSTCPAASKAVWVAFQDGNGTWTRVTGTGDVYTFTFTSAKGGYAYVTLPTGTTSTVNVQYQTTAEIAGTTTAFCGGPNTLTGTVAGLATNDLAAMGFGGASAAIVAPSTAYTLNRARVGTYDMIGYRRSLVTPGVGDHGFLRRDVVSTNGAVLAVADFNGSESYIPITASMSITGGLAGDTFTHLLSYFTGAACSGGSLYFATTPVTSPFTAFGVPAAVQRASDYHVFTLGATNASASTRSAFEIFHTFAARSIAMPPDFPVPTVSVGSGPYKVLAATINTTGYNAGAGLNYFVTATGAQSANISASAGWMASTTPTLTMPDLSVAAGWLNSYMPAIGVPVTWTIQVSGSNITTSLCVEGGRVISASRTGSM